LTLARNTVSGRPLRIAAKVANEDVMIVAFLRGEDLHTLTAKQILGKE
jgi:DNA polymerase I-like protein with 3'-5' exonuclease and polymerase domains